MFILIQHYTGEHGSGVNDTNTSILSAYSDEGLDLSQKISESLFIGPGLDPDVDEVVTGVYRSYLRPDIDFYYMLFHGGVTLVCLSFKFECFSGICQVPFCMRAKSLEWLFTVWDVLSSKPH